MAAKMAIIVGDLTGLQERYHHKIYSQISLIQTPKGQNQLPALQSCPYHRGRECMIFGISETKRTVRNRQVSVRKGYTVPHLVEKIKGFLLKAKSSRNTATNQKLQGGVPSPPPSICTTVGVCICVYVPGLKKRRIMQSSHHSMR